MTRKPVIVVLLIAFLCSFAPMSTLATAATTPHADEVTIAIDGEPDFLCPLISDSMYTSILWNMIAASPVGMTPKGELVADLCTTVPSTANGDLVRNADGTVTTTIRLRKGLLWSDGVPITIDDYIFAHKLYVTASIQVTSRSPMDLVTSIKRVDDQTCTVTWQRWDPYIPCGWDIYPEHVLGPIFDKDPKLINTCDYMRHPVHAGPYLLDVDVHGQYTTFKANPLYWQKNKPFISRVTVKYIYDPNAMTAALTSGQIDVSTEFLTLSAAQSFEKANADQFNVFYNESTDAGIIEWNLTSTWFQDKRVRQAFYYGIDRNLVTLTASVGKQAIMSPISSGSTYYSPVLAKYNYSVDKANALLDAAGWTWNAAHTERLLPDGTAAVLKVQTAGASVRMVELALMEPMLAKLGVTIAYDYVDFDAMLANAMAGKFTINIHGINFSNYDMFGSISQFHSNQIPTAANGMAGQNDARYSNPEMDKWIDAVQKATTVMELEDAYSHIQDLWAEDLPCLYLEQRAFPDVVHKGLNGYDHSFSSSDAYCTWNIQDWHWGNLVNAEVTGDATGGSLTGSSRLIVNDGDTATFQVSINPGYSAMVSPGVLAGTTWTIPNVTADTTATITFAKAGHTVTAGIAGDFAGGSIRGTNPVTVNDGDAAVFQIPTSSGYAASVSTGTLSGSTWTIPNVTADMRATVTFTKTRTTLTLILQIGNARMSVAGSDGSSETVTLDAAPVLGAGNRTLVPVRAVAEAMGGTVGWDPATRTASVTVGSNTLELTLGKNTALFNGTTTPIDTDSNVLPLIVNGRTMLPLRFVVESLGAEVAYDQATKTITIMYTKT